MCFDTAKALRGSDRLKLIKCWSNGWVTSYRMHEENLRNCLVGCPSQPDSLGHYLQCPHMFAFMRFFVANTSADPLIRWGLRHPSVESLKLACCAFSAYHAVKAQIRMQGSCFINQNDGHISSSALRANWSLFADSFRAEAGELAIPVRAFSLPNFLNFLMHDNSVQAH